MLKIRRPLGRLIFNMGITIPGKTVFLIETAPCFSWLPCQVLFYLCFILIILGACAVYMRTKRTHDVILTSLLGQNDVATSFWRNNDIIITSCVNWVAVVPDIITFFHDDWPDVDPLSGHPDQTHNGIITVLKRCCGCCGSAPFLRTSEGIVITGYISIYLRYDIGIMIFRLEPCHGWPSTQPGSLHTALQRKYTQPCSLFSRGTAVWTMGARLCERWGTAVCKCPAV